MRSVRFSSLLLLLTLLAGCVTDIDPIRPKVDVAKAEQAHVDAGFAYLRNRDKESARRHFQRALGLNASSGGAYTGLALVYQYDNDAPRADEYFQRALALQPENSRARFNYSSFLYQEQRYQDAEKHLLILADDVSYNRRYLALMNLGRTQLQLGDEDGAVKHLRQALGLNPRLALANIELARIFFERKEYPTSKFYLDQYNVSKRGRPSAASLWLKVRLERIFGNKDQEASAALALKNMYPYSDEYLQYKKTVSE